MDKFKSDGERIYDLWDQYARHGDVEGLLSLYEVDATLETPLINAIFDTDNGVVRGEAELRHFFTEGGRRRPNRLVRWHRIPNRPPATNPPSTLRPRRTARRTVRAS